MITFKTKADAVSFLDDLCEKGLLYRHSDGYSEPGRYDLCHGEYAAPDYRPARYADGWAVSCEKYFHAGTFDAPQGRFRIDLWVETEYVFTHDDGEDEYRTYLMCGDPSHH